MHGDLAGFIKKAYAPQNAGEVGLPPIEIAKKRAREKLIRQGLPVPKSMLANINIVGFR